MGEIVNILVAFAVIIFLFRWMTSGNTTNDTSRPRSPAEVLGFRPKNVTQEMITTISHMFPDIPTDNIRFDLLRSGSVEVTTNKILERGYLDAPPAGYYTLYSRTNTNAPNTPGGNTQRPTPSQRSAEKQPEKKETLISKFKLERRVAGVEEIKEDDIGGKAAWEDTAEKREASLKERKAKMILAARQRLLTQQQKDDSAIASSSSSIPMA